MAEEKNGLSNDPETIELVKGTTYLGLPLFIVVGKKKEFFGNLDEALGELNNVE